LSGSRPFTLATIIRLEEALRIKLRPATAPNDTTAPSSGSAPLELGGYSPAAVKWLEGDYLTLRPSFEAQDAIYAYRISIAWSADDNCLRPLYQIFREHLNRAIRDDYVRLILP
jgi:hypothetical protein